MEELKPLFDTIMAQSTWVESNSLLAQQDMRERCANVAVDVAKRLLVERDKRIAELEAQLAAMEENFQAVRRDRDELEQELLGLKTWQPA